MRSLSYLTLVAVCVLVGLLCVTQSLGVSGAANSVQETSAKPAPTGDTQSATMDWAVLSLVAAGAVIVLLRPKKRREAPAHQHVKH